MYTIFKNECKIILTDSLEFEKRKGFFYWNSFDLTNFLKDCNFEKSKSIYLFHNDLELLWTEFMSQFKIIEAAGGIVQNKNKEVLFIFRNDKWDLPKGKVEKNESIQETAIREVEEECGIFDLSLKQFIKTTYHIYEENNKQILKLSHWYKMTSNSNNLKPQLEEGITEVCWKDKEEIKKAMQNTYPNIKLLLDGFLA